MEEKKETNTATYDTPSLLAVLKVITIEWLETSTAHAIPNIVRTSNNIIRVMWLMCLLTSGSYCIYSMVKSLNEFLEYPYYTSTEIVQEIPAPFPAVTICNIKTINKTAASAYFSNSKFRQYFINPSGSRSTLQYILNQQYLARTAISNDTTLTFDTRRKLGYTLEDMLIACNFNYDSCEADDFVYFYSPTYGNCYTFNKGVYQNGTQKEIKTVSISEPLYGLILELYLGEPNTEGTFEYNDGVIVSIHNQTAMPFTDDVKTMASTGADTDIVVSKHFISRLESPYGYCLKDISVNSPFSSLYFDYIVKTVGETYSQKYCFALCMQKQVIDTCNCTHSLLPTFRGNNSFCLTALNAECIYELLDGFGKSAANKECQAACPFECDTIEYEKTLSRSTYPTRFYQKILSQFSLIKYNNISYNDIPYAVAKVNVFYKNMLYKSTVETIAISTESFFSNMGGTLGLYIGISMLSLVEIVELAINIVFAIINHGRSRKKVNSTSGASLIMIQPNSKSETNKV